MITGQQLLYWSEMTVDEDAPLIEGRPLMQLCAAFCRPLRKEEATCAEQYPVKPSCCTACSKRCNPGHSYAGDMQEGMQKIRMAQMPVDVPVLLHLGMAKTQDVGLTAVVLPLESCVRPRA